MDWGEAGTREWELARDSAMEAEGLAVTISAAACGDLLVDVEDGSDCGAMTLRVCGDYAAEQWDAEDVMRAVHACMGGADGDGRPVMVTWEDDERWQLVEE